MSCNRNTTKPLPTTVTILSQDNGVVRGQLTRLRGSYGTLSAIPNPGYKFIHWEDENSQIISTDATLIIHQWDTMSVSVVFEEIILSLSDFTEQDAHETLLFYLEKHGVERYDMGLLPGSRKYSASNFSSDSLGTGSRLSVDGSQVCTFPVTYGYNRGNPDANSPETIGGAIYDESTNTVTRGQYVQNPTGEKRDYVSLPDLLSVPVNSWSFPTATPFRGYSSIACPSTHNLTYWNTPRFTHYTTPQPGHTPSQFPLMQYNSSLFIGNWYHAEYLDLTGLEHAIFQYYQHTNSSFNGKTIKDFDTVSTWKDFRVIFPYDTNRPMVDATKSLASNIYGPGPRFHEPLVFNTKLTHVWIQPRDSESSGSQADDVNQNNSWKTQYQSKPQSGSFLHPLRYSGLTSLNLPRHTNVTDFSLLSVYFKSLNSLWYSYSSDNQPTTLDIPELNIHELYLTSNGSERVTSFDFLQNADIKSIHCDEPPVRVVTTLLPLSGNSITKCDLDPFKGLLHDPLHDERVKLHMNFDSQQILTQDSTRYANKLNNHGATIVDT